MRVSVREDDPGYTSATITDKRTGQAVARVHLANNRSQAVVDVAKPFRKIGR